MDTFLGIDGGGSKTRALLVDADGQTLHYAESGPSNLNSCGEDLARASLSSVVQQCIGGRNALPSATCFGIAGAGSREVKAQLEKLIQPLGLPNIRITSDAAIALEGAFPGGPGILLIAGTGSVCFGKSGSGDIQRTGGWGWLADDAGSASWIGQHGLECALQQNDGRIPGSALRDAVFAELEIDCSQELNARLHQPLLSRSKLAELSICVLGCAQAGDEAARRIQELAIDELEKLVRATTAKLQGRVTALAFSGGLLRHQPAFRQQLESRLADFQIQEAPSSPLEGAVALARHHNTNPDLPSPD